MVKSTMIKKILKRWGKNLVVVVTKAEERAYNLKEGDIVDVSHSK